MPIPSDVNVRAAVEALDQLAAFAKAFQDARTVLDALANAEQVIEEIDKEIASKRAELDQLRNAELAAAKAEGERHRDSILTAAREQATKMMNDARREREAVRADTAAMTEKRDKLRREIENVQATVARLAG